MMNVGDVRKLLTEKYKNEDFVIDKTGVKTIEIIGASFIADEPSIFGKVNEDWNRRELDWYLSQSLSVNDIEEPIPAVWKSVSSTQGMINSNYGWTVFSKENGNQYEHVLAELKHNKFSRRGQMIYTRPSMHTDWNKDGMCDFMCCSNTIHMIRNDKLISNIYFRSNDVCYGYRGDFAFMNYVHNKLANDLDVEAGDIIWNAASFHVYERHFNLLK
jgi:thymidylate synthase